MISTFVAQEDHERGALKEHGAYITRRVRVTVVPHSEPDMECVIEIAGIVVLTSLPDRKCTMSDDNDLL